MKILGNIIWIVFGGLVHRVGIFYLKRNTFYHHHRNSFRAANP